MTADHTPTDDLQARMDGYWSLRAEDYDSAQRRPGRVELDREVWSRIWSEALPPPPSRVLDLGTGSGHVALLLASLGHEVTGVDSAPGMLAQAERHAQAARHAGQGAPAFVRGDAVAPPGHAGEVDAVTSRYLLWTLRDPAAALCAWWRLLRPGGVLAMVDGAWFPEGIGGAGGDASDDPDFTSAYAGADAALRLTGADHLEVCCALARDAGFVDVTVTPLEEVLALDRAHGAAPGHHPRLQHLVRARRP